MAKGKYLRKEKVSTGKKIGRAVLIIVLVIVLLLAAVVAFVWSKLNKITFDDGSYEETIAVVETVGEDTAETTPVETEPAETIDMSGLQMDNAPIYTNGDLLKDDKVMNILLVGTDEFTEGFVKSSRGDVNIMVSINKAEKTVKLVSFSRGIALQMLDGPYKGKYEWLTNVHRWAGTEAVLQAMEDNFKIECDRYVRVNFNSVMKIVDIIGGVDIELTAQEARFMNEVLYRKDLKEGVNHLNGRAACYYARLRGVDDDWHRIQRQRTAILAVVEKLKGSSFATLNNLCDQVMPMIMTNLTKMEIAELILYSPNFLESEFDQMTIPLENSYTGMTVMSGSGGWALNYEKNNAALHEFLYSKKSNG